MYYDSMFVISIILWILVILVVMKMDIVVEKENISKKMRKIDLKVVEILIVIIGNDKKKNKK